MLSEQWRHEDIKYWKLKMEGDNHVAQNAPLNRDYARLDVIVVNKKQQIKQLKEELQQIIKRILKHMAIIQQQAIYDKIMQILENEAKQLQDALEKHEGIKHYYSQHRLCVYDELQMNYINMKTKMKAIKLKQTYINKWWNLVQDMVQKEINSVFN